jgi:hypothetical protein
MTITFCAPHPLKASVGLTFCAPKEKWIHLENYTLTLDPLNRLRSMPRFFAQAYDRIDVPRVCEAQKLCPVVLQELGDSEATPDEAVRRNRRFFWLRYLQWGLLPADAPDVHHGILTWPLEVLQLDAQQRRCLVIHDEGLMAGVCTHWRAPGPLQTTLGFHPNAATFAPLTCGGALIPLAESDWRRWLDVETPLNEALRMLATL